MTAAPDTLRVIVCGYIVRGPLGGLAWHHLQYVLGLHRLGHRVCFFEDSDDYESCYDPSRDAMGTDPTYGLAFAADAFDRLGIGDQWVYFDSHRGTWHGPLAGAGPTLFEGADLLVNISGVNPPRTWWDLVTDRVLIDTDPVFTQIRHLDDPAALDAARAHTSFFTYAENVGAPGTTVPDDGLPWRPTRQPIVLDVWPVTPGPEGGAWTTVMQWDSYPERTHGATRYGMKSRSFDDYRDLPSLLPEASFQMAVGSPTAPRQELADHGWGVLDPLKVTRDPWSYQRFVEQSKGEFSVAKHGYVVSGSGWFSERTAGYLASGRPAVVQDTGFPRVMPTGRGLMAFTCTGEAVSAIEQVSADYPAHCHAARRVAEEAFDHRRVLSELIANL